MIRRRKILIWGSVLLFVIPLLFIGTWFGVNLWPRKMEPPLWTEADLAMPDEKDKNGYYFLLQMRGSPNFEALEIPDDLFDLLPPFTDDAIERIQFWMKAKKLEPQLSTFLKEKSAALQEYQKLLALPQFVNQDPLSIEAKSPRWIALLDLHKIGLLHVVQKILESDFSAAYTFWLKMFQFDQSSLNTARSPISHLVALSTLDLDLKFLSVMRTFTPPDGGDSILQALKSFDPEKTACRRALIFEYLHQWIAVQTITAKAARDAPLWITAVFNPAVFRRDLNNRFRQLDKFVEAPQSITEKTIQREEQEMKNLRKGWFWWFYNPGGKIFQQLLSVNLLDTIKQFYESRDELQKYRTHLLAKPLFIPAETQAAPETQGQSESAPSPSPGEETGT